MLKAIVTNEGMVLEISLRDSTIKFVGIAKKSLLEQYDEIEYSMKSTFSTQYPYFAKGFKTIR